MVGHSLLQILHTKKKKTISPFCQDSWLGSFDMLYLVRSFCDGVPRGANAGGIREHPVKLNVKVKGKVNVKGDCKEVKVRVKVKLKR